MRSTLWLSPVVALMVVTNLACDVVPFPLGAPEGIPKEVQFVVNNESTFITADDPLIQVTPGTPIDDLDTLAGCWGVVLTDENGEPTPGRVYFVQRFDADTGEFQGWVLEDILGLAVVLAISEGTYAVTDESHIELVTLVRGGNQFTGEIELDPVDPPLRQVGLATLSGDGLNFLLGTDDPEDITDESETLIFRRFDCP